MKRTPIDRLRIVPRLIILCWERIAALDESMAKPHCSNARKDNLQRAKENIGYTLSDYQHELTDAKDYAKSLTLRK